MITKHINLYVIDKIFSEERCKRISVYAKMVYINCLINYFKDKEPFISNFNEFELHKSCIKNLDKFSDMFDELVKANLVLLKNDNYLFLNTWTKYMDISRMQNDVSLSKSCNCMDFYDSIKKSTQLIDLCGMKNKIPKEEVVKLMDLFFSEQSALDTKYPNEQECRKHFLYWIAYNKNKPSGEKVKSTSKILGLS